MAPRDRRRLLLEVTLAAGLLGSAGLIGLLTVLRLRDWRAAWLASPQAAFARRIRERLIAAEMAEPAEVPA
jgi:hypothetical protein